MENEKTGRTKSKDKGKCLKRLCSPHMRCACECVCLHGVMAAAAVFSPFLTLFYSLVAAEMSACCQQWVKRNCSSNTIQYHLGHKFDYIRSIWHFVYGRLGKWKKYRMQICNIGSDLVLRISQVCGWKGEALVSSVIFLTIFELLILGFKFHFLGRIKNRILSVYHSFVLLLFCSVHFRLLEMLLCKNMWICRLRRWTAYHFDCVLYVWPWDVIE